ncbi:MAG: TRAP transporter fused permease subunit [Desulfarculaceae bacterium]|nr:TRAP transporter fused permease subunit [Desulfarculaceae bacterium]MCF8073173.1 TRAP transporter fused permease subunit [Desulfarculaceae bacterium]MCF8100769.1 TRAP transporter fused permease subunit [Desulfarculaceae bacterium]MCF8118416.1 TRAP transporter fused permease subunit [Desulfarculaceae bacterium]
MLSKINLTVDKCINILAILLSLISLYTAFFGTFETMAQRTMHLSFISVIAIFLYKTRSAEKFPLLDLSINTFLAVAIVAANIYLMMNWKELYISPFLDLTGIIMGSAAIFILLELTRRTVGIALAIIVLIFLLYAYFGQYVPGFLGHRGYNLERIIVQVFAGTEGIYGIPLGVCASIVIIFLLFGSFLEHSGVSNILLALTTSIAGRYRGGPAKVSVVASGLMGMLSGSSAANVATTGAVTIPMMKKSGVEPAVAGAIEAVASSGGYKTPPIMGAVAFVMANMLGAEYVEVCIAAALPALFHYFGLFLMVDFYAGQKQLHGLPKDKINPFWPALKRCAPFLVPVALLMGLMVARYSAMYACAYSLLALWIISIGTRQLKLDGIYKALRDGAVRMVPITIPCAVAGIILGLLTLTGAGMKLSQIIDFLAQGSLFLTLFWVMIVSIILGMGLPPVVSYLVLAALEAPILIGMGVTPMAAHLFIFYFCALSLITPPICTTSFTAAAIAGSNPMKTGLEAVRFGIVLYTLPYLFVYNPALLFDGDASRIIYVVCIAAIGIFSLSIGAQGYFLSNLNWPKRALFVVASIFIFWTPYFAVTLAGITILAIMVIHEVILKKKVNVTAAV